MEKQSIAALIAMVVGFAGIYFCFHRHRGATVFALLGAAILGAFFSGFGFPLRHLVEGEFGYLDIVMVILTGIIFLRVLEANGSILVISKLLVKYCSGYPLLFLFLTLLFLYLPGMVTGLGAPAVLITGAMVIPILLKAGLSKNTTAALVSFSACMGSVTGPVNIPAMIVCNCINMPFEGFQLILPAITIPSGIIAVLILAYRPWLKRNLMNIKADFQQNSEDLTWWRALLPIMVVALLMILVRVAPSVVPDLHTPLIFVIGTVCAWLTGKRVVTLKTLTNAVDSPILEISALLLSVGVLVQISTLTGVTGLLVVKSLSLPHYLIYLGMSLALPILGGALSMLGVAAILGMPIVLALLGQNTIVITAMVSILCALSQLTPPSAIVGLLAGELAETENYNQVLKVVLVPSCITIALCLTVAVFSNKAAALLL
ncbi:MAG TPA: hypothetical protein VIM29_01850 [Bacillota bacterium]